MKSQTQKTLQQRSSYSINTNSQNNLNSSTAVDLSPHSIFLSFFLSSDNSISLLPKKALIYDFP